MEWNIYLPYGLLVIYLLISIVGMWCAFVQRKMFFNPDIIDIDANEIKQKEETLINFDYDPQQGPSFSTDSNIEIFKDKRNLRSFSGDEEQNQLDNKNELLSEESVEWGNKENDTTREQPDRRIEDDEVENIWISENEGNLRAISVDVQSRPHGKYRKRKQVVNKTDKIITGGIQQHQPDRGNEIWDNEPTVLNGNNATIVKQPEEKIKQGGKHKNLYLIGLLYLFATGNSLVDLFCIASIYDCVSNLNFKEYSIALVFHLLRILFIGLQVIFLQVFIIALIKISDR